MIRTDAVAQDTDRKAFEVQGDIYARIGGAARADIAFRLTDAVRRITQAGIRHRHPEYSNEQVFQAWARLKLGDDLTRAV